MEIQIREGSSEQKRKLKVCAYCRVSTDADEQENSLENQIRHYETVIKANPDYEYAGVYSDNEATDLPLLSCGRIPSIDCISFGDA